jgi:hypothetical protein
MIKHIVPIAFAALAVCVTATAGPSRAELTALLANPTSDWMVQFPDLNYEGATHEGPITEAELVTLNKHVAEQDLLHQVADLDAMSYYKTHPTPTDALAALEVGKAHAFKHNLIGNAATSYGLAFGQALSVLYTN